MEPVESERRDALLVVVACEAERRAVEAGAGAGTGILVCGVGAEAATRGAASIRARQPRVVLHMGFAGGLRPGLSAGDLVLVTGLGTASLAAGPMRSTPAPPIPLESAPVAALRSALARLPQRLAQGPLLTVDRFVDRAREKSRLGRSGLYLCCDMEAALIHAAAVDCGAVYAGVRVISDPADEDVVPAVRDGQGRPGFAALRRALAWGSRPLSASADVLRMLRGGRRARAALARAAPVALSALGELGPSPVAAPAQTTPATAAPASATFSAGT